MAWRDLQHTASAEDGKRRNGSSAGGTSSRSSGTSSGSSGQKELALVVANEAGRIRMWEVRA